MPVPLICTYRLQLHGGWGFTAAAELADYLAALGISHMYTSPCQRAVAGSTHGYDVVDPARLNEELGGEQGHARLAEALQEHGLGRVQDIVPNHMAISGPDNPWWWDILENGQCSPYARYFDVQWQHPEGRFRDLILLPVLGDHYGRVLESGEIQVARRDGDFLVCYHDHRFPLSPRSLSGLLHAAAESVHSKILRTIAEQLAALPHATQTDRASIEQRHRDKKKLCDHLRDLCLEHVSAARAIDSAIEQVNGQFVLLDELLSRQNYRLAYWRLAQQELSYRRFFDINTLVGLRVEDEQVFADSHARVIEWANTGVIDGIRVDHPDGLYDPQGYFDRLRAAAPDTWLVAEKILEPAERLRQSWPVHGTTGYDFLNCLTGLFVDPSGESQLTACYTEFTGETADYHALVHDKKCLVLRDVLSSDINRLAALLLTVCENHPRHRDYARQDLVEALTELVAAFPVYRTYVRPQDDSPDEQDVRWIKEAVETAGRCRPDLPFDLLQFIGQVLQLRLRGEEEYEFVMRFQQLTGAAMAKGVEDTAFYCFNRLVSLNEVGGDPGQFCQSLETFHHHCRFMHEHWPLTMLATSTHDTKRSEDVRARICLLSEIPAAWRDAVTRWSKMNEQHRRDGMPDQNMEYLLYQNLVGAWPIEKDRILAYATKASREAKVHTSWIRPDPDYDDAMQAFVAGLMDSRRFTADLAQFVEPLVSHGRANSLAQTLLKLTAPGIPDIYQGTELWDLSLVDPDNRRPVGYPMRRRALSELDGMQADQVLRRVDEGLPKLFLIRRALACRRQHPELFGADGSYEPLYAVGEKANHVVAFVRGGRAITIVPRLTISLAGGWQDTTVTLPPGTWNNVLSGSGSLAGTLSLADALAAFPVALLLRINAHDHLSRLGTGRRGGGAGYRRTAYTHARRGRWLVDRHIGPGG